MLNKPPCPCQEYATRMLVIGYQIQLPMEQGTLCHCNWLIFTATFSIWKAYCIRSVWRGNKERRHINRIRKQVKGLSRVYYLSFTFYLTLLYRHILLLTLQRVTHYRFTLLLLQGS